MIYAFDIIGLTGVALIIAAYLMLQIDRLKANGFLHSFLNMIGALFILISFYQNWNTAAFVVEVFWLIISLFGIARYFARR